jgi:hypothetical protein
MKWGEKLLRESIFFNRHLRVMRTHNLAVPVSSRVDRPAVLDGIPEAELDRIL